MTFGNKVRASLVALLFIGMFLGYSGAYLSYRLEDDIGNSFATSCMELFSLLSIPGQIITAILSDRDWKFGEVWEHRHAIAWYNSCFYLITGFVILVLIVSIKRIAHYFSS